MLTGKMHSTNPRGTAVKLFFYPPLPEEIGNVREIPDRVGETPDQARRILAGKSEEPFFTIAAVVEKEVTPEGERLNRVYATIPEIGRMELRGTASRSTSK